MCTNKRIIVFAYCTIENDKQGRKAMKDLTKGRPIKLIFWFAVPLLLGNVFQQLYNLADTRIVGQFLGEESFAAVFR